MGFLGKRSRDSHKGDNGRVLVIGGSEDYVGAPALAGMAALRSGCDYVVVACPSNAAWSINSLYPDLITKKLEGNFINWDNVSDLIEMSEDFDVVLIGNGIGTEESTMDVVKELVERIPDFKVIDADGLKALKDAEFVNTVMTPHAGEFEIMADEDISGKSREYKARLLQAYTKKDTVILLKGNTDIIASDEKFAYNNTGNPGMTIAGTGDVLAGITAGFLAQSKDMFKSAVNAAYLNGKAGDYLLRQKGYGFTASDMLDVIPAVKKRIIRWR
ncbi:NAD(P)H-hydrate dehydratase [Candidatus Woesearchaeota archaeon]|nr:NAD(P)H-hydrate dehydratase [Candidatus Woesearchaeota archaeon]